MDARGDALGDFFGHAEGGAGDAAADGFAKDQHVGIELPFSGAATGAGADGMGFVGDEEGAVTAREFLGGGPKAVFGEVDAGGGHGGRGEGGGGHGVVCGVLVGVDVV